jgi:hypothetical protein
VVTVVAAWMLDPMACAGMEIGPPRVSLAALIELRRLLNAQGLGGSFPDDATVVTEEHDEASDARSAGRAAPTQHGARFPEAGGMSPGQRAAAVAALANLLREAARAAEEAHDDDRL